jgi:hypothetical protein
MSSLKTYLKVSSVLLSSKPSLDGENAVAVLPMKKLGRLECRRCKHWSHTCLCNYDHLCDRCMTILLDYPEYTKKQEILNNLEERGLEAKDMPSQLNDDQENIWDYLFLKHQQRDESQEHFFQALKEEVSKYLTVEQL